MFCIILVCIFHYHPHSIIIPIPLLSPFQFHYHPHSHSIIIPIPIPLSSSFPFHYYPHSRSFSAMSSDRNKELFLQQVQQILEGIKQDKNQLMQKCLDEKKDKDSLNKSYLDLIEQQRSYYKAVKDFQEVCHMTIHTYVYSIVTNLLFYLLILLFPPGVSQK